MDEYPPPDERWVRIGKNSYKLEWSKKTEEEKKRARKIMKQIKIRNEVKNIINGIIDDVVNLSEGKK